jgi:hypothetical protein
VKSWKCEITRGYCECRKDCTQEFLRIFEVVTKYNLRRDRDFEEFEGGTRVEVILQKEISRGRTPSSLVGVIKNLNGWLKSSEGEPPIFCGPLYIVDQ